MAGRFLPLLLLTALLAGCAGDPKAPDADPDTPGVQAEGAPVPFTVTSPAWQVGQWWSHHWTSPDAGLDFTVKSIVAGNASGTHVVATDDEMIAAQHAAFFFMDLGEMGADGTMRSGDFAFPWYQFPLVDNKTWTAQEKNLANGFDVATRDITFTARQMGTGAGAHFMIEGKVGDKLYVEYDYKPEIGWFSEFKSYSLDAEGDVNAQAFGIKTEAQGTGYTGPHFSSVGDLLVNTQTLVHPGSTSPPAAATAFTLDDAHTHAFALAFSFAAGGASYAQVTAPDGQHWEATAVGDPDGNNVAPPPSSPGSLVLADAQAGQWQVSVGGAGVVAGGGAIVWGVAITEGTL